MDIDKEEIFQRAMTAESAEIVLNLTELAGLAHLWNILKMIKMVPDQLVMLGGQFFFDAANRHMRELEIDPGGKEIHTIYDEIRKVGDREFHLKVPMVALVAFSGWLISQRELTKQLGGPIEAGAGRLTTQGKEIIKNLYPDLTAMMAPQTIWDHSTKH